MAAERIDETLSLPAMVNNALAISGSSATNALASSTPNNRLLAEASCKRSSTKFLCKEATCCCKELIVSLLVLSEFVAQGNCPRAKPMIKQQVAVINPLRLFKPNQCFARSRIEGELYFLASKRLSSSL